MIKNKFHIKQRVFFIRENDKLCTSIIQSIHLNLNIKNKNGILYGLQNQNESFTENELYGKRDEAKKEIKKYYESKIKELNK